ncbi:MAG: hypothetical protein CM1200mP8_6990 [Chloroflexota bacterium]|nr:MAG: hypothetical protein CM1200mP8_6990 [Chloroflexota bacterium]
MKLNVAILPGDGVGPEVTAEAEKVLHSVVPYLVISWILVLDLSVVPQLMKLALLYLRTH